MITYNVKDRFFEMKADAETYRKEVGGSLIKLVINDRKQLTALLNAIAGIEPSNPEAARPAPEAECKAPDEIPDFIPKFLREESERRNRR